MTSLRLSDYISKNLTSNMQIIYFFAPRSTAVRLRSRRTMPGFSSAALGLLHLGEQIHLEFVECRTHVEVVLVRVLEALLLFPDLISELVVYE